jgi:2'-5' RNA ligase
MATTIRAFIAIELSGEEHRVLSELQHRLKATTPPRAVRWTAPENIHLTLHFLGDVAAGDVRKIGQTLSAAAAVYPPFSLSLGGLGCFPTMRRPRIVWLGVGGDVSILQELQQRLGQKLGEAINFRPDARPYSPHLTLGRVKDGLPQQELAQLGQALEQMEVTERLATLPVTEISLIKSELKSGGPVYTKLSGALLTSRR